MPYPATLSSAIYSYNYYQQDILLYSILECLPKAVCVIPIVKNGSSTVDEEIVTAVMAAIKLGWIVARGVGASSIAWTPGNELVVKYGAIMPLQMLDQPEYYHIFGTPVPYSKSFGLPCINEHVLERICAYREMLKYVAGRIKNSYNLMLAIAGELATDLAQSTREEIDRRYEQSRVLQAPEGSSLHAHSVTLADTDKVSQPFKEAIAIEANLPSWLLFKDMENLATTQFQLEGKAMYLQSEFESVVKPAIIGIFKLKGMDVKVATPSFRDELHISSVAASNADVSYKKASAASTRSTTDLAKQQFEIDKNAPTPKPTASVKTAKELPSPNQGRKL